MIRISFEGLARAGAQVLKIEDGRWFATIAIHDAQENTASLWTPFLPTKGEALMAMFDMLAILNGAAQECAKEAGMVDWEDSVAALGAGAEAVPELPGGGA